MKNRRRLVVGLGIVLLVGLFSGGLYFLRAGAENRPYDTAIQGPRPASQISAPPTATPGSSAQVVRSDTFAQLPSDWKAVDRSPFPDKKGVWSTENGSLAAIAPAAGGDYEDTLYLAPVNTSGKTSISVQVFPQGNLVVGLAFRATDQGYYLFRVFSNGGADKPPIHRQLQRYDAQTGTYVTLAEDRTGRGYDLGRWQQLRVDLDGDLITASFDGEQVFQVRDSTFASGDAGVYTLNVGDVLFNQFVVTKP